MESTELPPNQNTRRELNRTACPKDQFDYAWKWFELHANQRVSMLNFFLIGVGILLAALATLLEKNLHLPAMAVAGVGVIVCLIFLGLEFRNSKLVKLAEFELFRLEHDWLFKDGQGTNDPDEWKPVGILKWDAAYFGKPTRKPPTWLGKKLTHGVLIPGVQILFAVCFLATTYYSWVGYECAGKLPDSATPSQSMKCILTDLGKSPAPNPDSEKPDKGG